MMSMSVALGDCSSCFSESLFLGRFLRLLRFCSFQAPAPSGGPKAESFGSPKIFLAFWLFISISLIFNLIVKMQSANRSLFLKTTTRSESFEFRVNPDVPSPTLTPRSR